MVTWSKHYNTIQRETVAMHIDIFSVLLIAYRIGTYL